MSKAHQFWKGNRHRCIVPGVGFSTKSPCSSFLFSAPLEYGMKNNGLTTDKMPDLQLPFKSHTKTNYIQVVVTDNCKWQMTELFRVADFLIIWSE